MPENKVVDAPMASDDDSISLTSTAPSEPKEEYPIEGILAERVINGTARYLVKWEGYTDERCTWEPKSSFQDDQTFHDWQNKKMRISRGLDLAYDVSALETRVENWIEMTEKRKARRRAKRIRLGLPVDSESEGENSDVNAAKALEEDSSDPDQPLKKRRGSSKSDLRTKQRRRWTPKEEAALKSGLELVKGPFWNEILRFFGPAGTKSQDLKDRDALDLEAKTLQLRIDYLKSGRGVPQYLQLADTEKEDENPRKLEESNWSDDKDSPSTEASLMKELQSGTVKQKPKAIEKQKEHYNGVKRSTPTDQRPKGLMSSRKGLESHRSPAAIPNPKVSIAQMVPRIEPGKGAVSKFRGESKMGSVGRGPLRLGLGARKLDSAGKRPRVTGAAILENWNASVKPQRRQLPLQNAAGPVDKPLERFGKLSTKRRYEKASRNERAPDLASLTLRNPKDFSIVKQPSIPSPTTKIPTKTPFELYQESFAKEKEEPAQIDNSTIASTFDIVESPLNVFDTGAQNVEPAEQKAQTPHPVAFPTRMTMASSPPAFPASFTPSGPRPLAYVAHDAFDKCQVLGTIAIGPDRLDLGPVQFRGLGPVARRLLLGLKSGPRELIVWLKYTLVPEDYKAFFQNASDEGDSNLSGYVLPFPQTEEKISMMVETLKMHVSGALLLANEFSMFVYPSGSEDWTFLDSKLPTCPPATTLRFLIRRPYPELMDEKLPKPLSDSTEERPSLQEEEEEEECPIDFETIRCTTSVEEGENNIDAVFRNVYKVEYPRLIASTAPVKNKQTPSFFLIFPPSKADERNLLIQFLQHNKASDIFSHETKGAWDYFVTHVIEGVLIIHENFFELWRIPNLVQALRKPINVWKFNLTPSPLSPDPHLNRLFPHGAAILLTDGLFLHRPHEAAKILTWFRLVILISKGPRTWRLCTRPRLKDWLLTLQNDRNMEDGRVFVQCYGEVWRMLKDEGMMEESIPEEEQPAEDAPMCFMGEVSAFDESVGKGVAINTEVNPEDIARNDKVLIEWFAGFAMTKVENFRRFDIVTGFEPGDWRQGEAKEKHKAQWSHVEVMPVEELYKKHKVPGWDVLEKEQEKRVKRMKEKWADEDAAAAKAEVESIAAKKAEAERKEKRKGRSRSNSEQKVDEKRA